MHNKPGGEPPVFVDRTGRRRRLSVIAGTAMGLGLLTSLGLIAAGLFSESSVPVPGWTDTKVQPPIEAGVDGLDELGDAASPSPWPSSVTSTAAPAPAATRTTAAGTRPTTAAPAAQPSTSTHPGQGDEHRTAKPSKSPGKSG